MAYSPEDPIVAKVEINLGTLGWVDVTTRGRKASCAIQQGRTANSNQADPSRLTLTIGNPDGWLTEGNAVSPYYPAWGRGCEIRVSRPDLSGSPERFHGQIDTLKEKFPGGNKDATVEVTAVGTLGVLLQGAEPLHSPMYRAMAGISEGDIQAIAHWSMEAAASRLPSSFPDQLPAAIGGAVTVASYTGFPGSSPLPVLGDGSAITARMPPYANTGFWQQQQAVMIPTAWAVDADLLTIEMVAGTTTARVVVRWSGSSTPVSPLTINAYNQAGSLLATNSGPLFFNNAAIGQPIVMSISDFTFLGNRLISVDLFDIETGTNQTSISVSSATSSIGTDNGRPSVTTAQAGGGVSGWAFGQLALYTDSAALSTPNVGPNARAGNGFTGETAGDRMVRLTREEGIAFELTGTAADTTVMGPQLLDTLVANLRDCETADQGLMHDNGTDGAISYRTRADLCNQAATIAVAQGAIEPDFEAIRDRQYTRNDITSSRPNGGSAHVSDEEHVALIRARLKDSRTPNVEADDQLSQDAAWAVHLGTDPGARYNSVGINLRNADGALLADSVAAHAIGDRLTVATSALPPQHTDSINGLTVGWTEYLDSDTWRFRANLMPYQPYEVFEIEAANNRGRLDTDGSKLVSSVTSIGTTLVVRQGAINYPQWITTAGRPGDFPFDIGIAGERITVTAIASAAKDQYARTVAAGSLGTADTGQSYTLIGTAANFSVTTTPFGHAEIVPGANGSDRVAYLTPTTSSDLVVEADVFLPALPASGSYRIGVVGRLSDSSNYVWAELQVNSSGAITLRLVERVAGSAAVLSSVAGGTLATSTNYTVRMAAVGTALRASVWQTTGGRFTGWTLPGTTSLSAGTSTGIIARDDSASTGHTFGFDRLETLWPQTFTAIRSVNGVVKAQAANAALSLWKPSVIAL